MIAAKRSTNPAPMYFSGTSMVSPSEKASLASIPGTR